MCRVVGRNILKVCRDRGRVVREWLRVKRDTLPARAAGMLPLPMRFDIDHLGRRVPAVETNEVLNRLAQKILVHT